MAMIIATVTERKEEPVDLAKEIAELKKVIANLQPKNVWDWKKGEIISTIDRVNDELHNTNASVQSTSGNKYHTKNSTPAGASPALRQPDRPVYWSSQRHSPVRRRSPARDTNRRDPKDGRDQHERRDQDDRRHRTPRQDERDERVRNNNKDRR